jgi:2-polyprenyl-6-methoxyphenol hydroxylase-like FAD-dependent oxidoreductase
MFNAPGRSATIHPARNTPLAAFIFWRRAVVGLDHRDLDGQRRVVEQTYARDGWHVPALLDAMRAADDLYFDSVSRVTVPTWSAGRVVLVGDAASCVSLLGDGSTLAMIGAHSLAGALAENGADLRCALQTYERRHRKLVEQKQRLMTLAARLLVPRTRGGIRLRNAAVRSYARGEGALRAMKRTTAHRPRTGLG